MNEHTPVITEMARYSVAGYDSMLMTLSGAHAPFFTRNLVVLATAQDTGIGEIHGGDYTCQSLEACISLVVGKEIGKYRHIMQDIHKAATGSSAVRWRRYSDPGYQ